jgi:phosphonate transport system permease protein
MSELPARLRRRLGSAAASYLHAARRQDILRSLTARAASWGAFLARRAGVLVVGLTARTRLQPVHRNCSLDPRRRFVARAVTGSIGTRDWLDGHRTAIVVIAGFVFYAACLYIADVDPGRLWKGWPRLVNWASRAWPPDFSDLGIITWRAAETVAMATVGTSFGAVIAAPLCVIAARNTAPWPWGYHGARAILDVLRSIDAFVFALVFVAAVGLGPFAGVLGIALHTAGSMAKLWSEAIEATEPGPVEAATMSGASHLKVVIHALLPDVMPALLSILLYMWEFNVRASTALGIVGAGGIGQELKNSVDLLAFDRLIVILLVVFFMVMAIDRASRWLRRKLI